MHVQALMPAIKQQHTAVYLEVYEGMEPHMVFSCICSDGIVEFLVCSPMFTSCVVGLSS